MDKRMLFPFLNNAFFTRTDDALDLPPSIGTGFAFAVQEILLHKGFLLFVN